MRLWAGDSSHGLRNKSERRVCVRPERALLVSDLVSCAHRHLIRREPSPWRRLRRRRPRLRMSTLARGSDPAAMLRPAAACACARHAEGPRRSPVGYRGQRPGSGPSRSWRHAQPTEAYEEQTASAPMTSVQATHRSCSSALGIFDGLAGSAPAAAPGGPLPWPRLSRKLTRPRKRLWRLREAAFRAAATS